MSSGQAGGSNLPDMDTSQITDLIQQLSTGGAGQAEKTSQAQTTTKTESNREIKDTSSKSEGRPPVEGTDPGKPALFQPVESRMGEPGTREHLSQTINEMKSTATLEATGEVKEQLETLAEEYPQVKLLVQAAGSEDKAMAKINEALAEMGISLPLNVADPQMSTAIKKALTASFKEMGIEPAKEKAEFYFDQLNGLKTMTRFAESLESIDPTGKTFHAGEGFKKVVDIVGSVDELVSTALEQLESGRLGGDMAILEFLQYIAMVIADLKEILTQLHIEDSKNSGEISRAIEEMQGKKREGIVSQMDKMREKMDLQKLMDGVQMAMRILGPIMAAVMILTSLVFLPVAPIVTIVMIALAIMMLAAMTTLTETGAMEEIFKFANNQVGNLGQKLGLSEGLSKVLFWVGTILAIAAVTVLLMLVPQVGLMVPMLILPILTTIITQSGFIDEIVGALQKEAGFSDTVKAILTGVFTMVITLVMTLGIELISLLMPVKLIKTIVKAFFTGGISLAIEAAISFVKDFVMNLLKAAVVVIKQVFQVIKNVLRGVFQMLKTAMKTVKQAGSAAADAITNLVKTLTSAARIADIVKATLSRVRDLLNKVKDAVVETVKKAINAGTHPLGALKNMTSKIRQKIDNILKYIDNMENKMSKLMTEAAKAIQMTGQATTASGEALANVGLGAITMRIAEITEEEGELAYIITLLTELIKSLEELMAKLQGSEGGEGVGEFMKQINGLSQMFESIVASMSGFTEDLAASAVV